MARVYVASSWRNFIQPSVVSELLKNGHEVYDFRHPDELDNGFHWYDIDPEWKMWSKEVYREKIMHPIAEKGFRKDFKAMEWADAFVLVQPCGRSSHLELGWACGAKKRTCILLSEGEPELMSKMADYLACTMDEVLRWLDEG